MKRKCTWELTRIICGSRSLPSVFSKACFTFGFISGQTLDNRKWPSSIVNSPVIDGRGAWIWAAVASTLCSLFNWVSLYVFPFIPTVLLDVQYFVYMDVCVCYYFLWFRMILACECLVAPIFLSFLLSSTLPLDGPSTYGVRRVSEKES